MQERIAWIVAVLLVGGAAFFGGRQMGFDEGQQNRGRAAQAFFAQRGGQGGQGAQGVGGARGQNVFGQVASVSGNTIVVTTQDGSKVNVQLAANGTIRKQVDGQVSDLTVGERIVALGTQSGDTFQANMIQVGNFGNFGGRGGQGGQVGNGGGQGGNGGGQGGNGGQGGGNAP